MARTKYKTSKSMRIIRGLRKKFGIRQSEFSKLIKVSTMSIGRYESGITFPSFDTIEKIIDFAKKRGIELKFEDFYENDL